MVDENDDFLDGLTDWFEGKHEIEVIGRAHSHAETLRKIAHLKPDLVLVDMALPDGEAFDIVRTVDELPDPPLVVMMSFHESELVQTAASSRGADGCITKADIPEHLVSHVETLIERRGSNSIRTRAPENQHRSSR